jgi:hypothetical protein
LGQVLKCERRRKTRGLNSQDNTQGSLEEMT